MYTDFTGLQALDRQVKMGRGLLIPQATRTNCGAGQTVVLSYRATISSDLYLVVDFLTHLSVCSCFLMSCNVSRHHRFLSQ